jgi:hypothetical protein
LVVEHCDPTLSAGIDAKDGHAPSLRPSATVASLSLSAREAAGRSWLCGYGMVSPVHGKVAATPALGAIAVASAIF